MKYNFTAKNKKGQTINDSLEAKSNYAALELLKNQGLTVVHISSSTDSKTIPESNDKVVGKKLEFFSTRKVNLTELSIFCRQFAVSVASGLTILDALMSITEDMDNLYFKEVLSRIVVDIKQGAQLSEALAKHKNIFGPIFIALMQSAEESGSMTDTLENLAVHFEKSVRLLRKIRSIATYPLFVLAFFVVVVLIMTVFILPKFENTFSNLGAQLPQITRIVFSINRFLINNSWVFALAIGAIMGSFFIYRRFPKGRYNIDRLKLGLPLFGNLIKKYAIARFCRVLSIMLHGGVAIGKALSVSSKCFSNKFLSESIDKIREDVMAGSDISSGLSRDNNFPCLVTRMVGVGESSGRLPEILNKISEMYEDQVDGSIIILTSLFEPIIIILFGGIVLSFVLAVYIPIFKLAMSLR